MADAECSVAGLPIETSERHVLSPLRGWGGILLEILTHGLRHGLRSFARFAGCEAGGGVAVPSEELTLLILDKCGNMRYSGLVRLADG